MIDKSYNLNLKVAVYSLALPGRDFHRKRIGCAAVSAKNILQYLGSANDFADTVAIERQHAKVHSWECNIPGFCDDIIFSN